MLKNSESKKKICSLMTRHEARMIAEELVKLRPEDYRDEEFLTVGELAMKLNISQSYIRHHTGIPRVTIGKTVRYPLNRVINYLNNN